jgi:hypothetical protein
MPLGDPATAPHPIEYLDAGVRTGEFLQDPRTRTFVEVLTDAEGDKYVRAALVGMLRVADRRARVGPDTAGIP